MLAPTGLLISSLALAGCRCDEDEGAPKARSASSSKTSEAPQKAATPTTKPRRKTQALLDLRDRCRIDEHGLIIDLGSRSAVAYENFKLVSDEPPEPVFFQGQSFRPLDQMSQDFVFWTREDLDSLGFEALVRGDASERMAVYVDGVRLGAAQLRPDTIRVVRISKSNHTLPAGRHRLTLALSRPRGRNPSADIGWIRLGRLSKTDSDQPTPRDRVFSEVSIGEDRQAGIVVKPGASVSCPLWLPESAQLTVQVGIWGAGLAEGEIVVVDQQGNEHVVRRILREEDDPRDFEQVVVDLGAYASKLIDLKFRARTHDRSARVVFGAPQLSHDEETASGSPRAKRAIVLVLSSLGSRHSPPASSTSGLPALSQLAQMGTLYPDYRASSTSSTAILTSLLTGLAPYQHGLHDEKQVLPQQVATLAGAVEAAGGRSAFMTGVPTSSAEFGFDRGFESFFTARPQEDKAATEPLSQAVAWMKSALGSEGPMLSIVHLRGAHPPFDIPRDRARELPPREYGGDLTPRRAAIQLGSIGRRPKHRQNMNEEDWTRLFAMEKAALSRQSAAIFEMIEWLRQENLYDDTLLIVTGDVAPGERPVIPYGGEAPLEEQFLSVPLVIKYPGGHLGARRVSGLFAPRDVVKTISASLGLDFSPDRSDAIDLGRPTAPQLARLRPHIAYRDGRYSMRLGSRLLVGSDGEVPVLCFLDIDPACQVSRGDDHPDMVHALWLTAFSTLNPALKRMSASEAMQPNEDFTNSLIVWGLLR